MLGRVTKYYKDKSYGYIRDQDSGDNYFCHVSQIDDGVLERGYIVHFQGRYNFEKDKKYAVKVQVVES